MGLGTAVSAEIIELLTRVAELERKLDSMFRHGPVHERKKIEKRWFVRLKVGGTDALASIESTLYEVRDRFLDAEKAVREKNEVLGKPLDSLYSEQKEWLRIRMLLANAIVRSSATKARVKKTRVKKARKNRAILLIDA
jgi:hypothetical protein